MVLITQPSGLAFTSCSEESMSDDGGVNLFENSAAVVFPRVSKPLKGRMKSFTLRDK